MKSQMREVVTAALHATLITMPVWSRIRSYGHRRQWTGVRYQTSYQEYARRPIEMLLAWREYATLSVGLHTTLRMEMFNITVRHDANIITPNICHDAIAIQAYGSAVEYAHIPLILKMAQQVRFIGEIMHASRTYHTHQWRFASAGALRSDTYVNIILFCFTMTRPRW